VPRFIVNLFTKCVLCDFTYLTCLNVYLLHIYPILLMKLHRAMNCISFVSTQHTTWMTCFK
jgi:hypothetical protein